MFRSKKNIAGLYNKYRKVYDFCYVFSPLSVRPHCYIKLMGGSYSRHCAIQREFQHSIPGGVLGNFSSDVILLSAIISLGIHSVSKRDEYQGDFLAVKCDRRVELIDLPSSLC